MKHFIKEWGLFILFITLFALSRAFIWQPVKVEGHSMDPTLADGERLIVLSHTSISRFDIIVASEGEGTQEKKIVKRVIGMPGDTISYKDDVLYVNDEKVEEPYLSTYLKAINDNKLQSIYSYNTLFQNLAIASDAFTTDSAGNPDFTVEVPQGEYFLLGDDRIVSKDSREVGTFKESDIIGEVKFRFWPLTEIGTVK